MSPASLRRQCCVVHHVSYSVMFSVQSCSVSSGMLACLLDVPARALSVRVFDYDVLEFIALQPVSKWGMRA
jgi:hypothetical protein